MTVTYNSDVLTCGFNFFVKLIFRWKGSVWKTVYAELCIWCLLYTALALIFHLALSEERALVFEKICFICYKNSGYLPVTFILSYFVSLVVSRWATLWANIGFIDDIALAVAGYVEGNEERPKAVRRMVVRYMCLYQVLVFRSISVVVKKRFPSLETLVRAGYIEKEELSHFFEAHSTCWLPVKWAMLLIGAARKEGLIQSDQAVSLIYDQISTFYSKIMKLWLTDWVSVPLTYTQVVFVCVRFYFVVNLLGRQYIDYNNIQDTEMNWYVPVLSVAEFIFFIGWCKVAEALLNPFGEDDEDFEVNFIIDRNLQKDKYFDEDEWPRLYSLQSAFDHQSPMSGYIEITPSRSTFYNEPITIFRLSRSTKPKYTLLENSEEDCHQYANMQSKRLFRHSVSAESAGAKLLYERQVSVPDATQLSALIRRPSDASQLQGRQRRRSSSLIDRISHKLNDKRHSTSSQAETMSAEIENFSNSVMELRSRSRQGTVSSTDFTGFSAALEEYLEGSSLEDPLQPTSVHRNSSVENPDGIRRNPPTTSSDPNVRLEGEPSGDSVREASDRHLHCDTSSAVTASLLTLSSACAEKSDDEDDDILSAVIIEQTKF